MIACAATTSPIGSLAELLNSHFAVLAGSHFTRPANSFAKTPASSAGMASGRRATTTSSLDLPRTKKRPETLIYRGFLAFFGLLKTGWWWWEGDHGRTIYAAI
jgi:hypothetical protein